MHILHSDERLSSQDLERLAQERVLINTLFTHLSKEVERLQPAIARLRQTRFFSEAAQIVDETIAVRFSLQTLYNRLLRLRQEWPISEDSPRFLLLENAVQALGADALLALADLIADGRLRPPVGSDKRLRTWAAILASPDLANKPAHAAAVRTLFEAADALPQIREFS